MHKVLVYGTLRPGNSTLRRIPGYICDLGAYPGCKLLEESEGKFFLCEEIEVDDDGLKRLDGYEGYSASNPENSLYIRVRLDCGAWIYEYNGNMLGRPVVPNGDWLAYTKRSTGSAAHLGQNNRANILVAEA